jgi:cytochrome d ubiquinol oxidase subunit I
MGRQPWIVQGLLKVQDGVTPNLTPMEVLISLVTYASLYSALAVTMLYLTRKYAIAGPEAAMHESVEMDPVFAYTQDE